MKLFSWLRGERLPAPPYAGPPPAPIEEVLDAVLGPADPSLSDQTLESRV